jgi:hypothetical protein
LWAIPGAGADRYNYGALRRGCRKIVINAMKEGDRAYSMMKPDYSEGTESMNVGGNIDE